MKARVTLSERLTIQAPVETVDGIGGRVETFSTLATVYAEPVPIRGDERLQAQALGNQADYRFRVRVRSDVTAKMRALWTPRWPPGQAQRTFEIRSVLFEPDRAFMLIDCAVWSA